MSYRNPKQFVDTETAKYYSNLQKTFSGITDDYVKQLNARRAAEAKRLAEVAEQNKKITIARNKYENETGSSIDGVTAITPNLFDDSAQKRISESIDIAADISTDMFASQEQKTYKQNVDTFNKVIIRDQTNLASYKEEFEEASNKEGQMGGYSVYNDPKQTAFVSAVLGGGLKGESSFNFDLTKPGGAETVYSWKQEGASEGFSLSGSMIAEIAANPDRDILVKVPNEAESMEQTINIFGRKTDEKGDPTAAVQEDLYIGQEEKFRIIRDGKKVIKQYYQEPNTKLLGEKIKQKVVASVEALSSNKNLVSNEQIALYNWFQDQKTEGKKPVIGFDEFNEASQEERDIFLDDLSAEYSTYAMRKYFTGNTELLTGTEEIIKPEEEKPKKLTEGDIRRLNYKDKIKYFDSRFTPDNLTFESVIDLANAEGIEAKAVYESEESTEPSEIKVGKLIIKKGDDPNKIKKILLIASGIEPKDADDVVKKQELSFRPNTGNLPIKK